MAERAFIERPKCDQNPSCPARRVCPQGAIVQESGAFVVRQERCTGCGICMRVCARGAINLDQ
ncbi:MAG: 4Fe-4S binding protein [Coriobacteriia bacterium]|nr:4Fe-4S binding protein [Coriobacteriia bacterium]